MRSFDENPSVVVGQMDPDDDAPDSRGQIGRDPMAALTWLLDPVESLWHLLEADALRLIAVDIDISDESPARCRLSWTVTVKLRDVAAFGRVARDACPGADVAGLARIDGSLAVAWRYAADPYAPLRAIPGITWTPVEVTVDHVPARANLNRTSCG